MLLIVHADARAGDGARHWVFEKAQTEIVFYSGTLTRRPPPEVARGPEVSGNVWYGRILRRLSDGGMPAGQVILPFLVLYRDGHPVELWCDADGDGDLVRENVVLPEPARVGPRRSFRVKVRPGPGVRVAVPPPAREVRIRLDRVGDSDPTYDLAWTDVPLGTVVLSGVPHRAVLFDGDGDGGYSAGSPDGIVVDLDDDGEFDIDVMGPEFGPFSVPFTLGGRRFRVTHVARDGRFVLFEPLEAAPHLGAPEVGTPAPDSTAAAWRPK